MARINRYITGASQDHTGLTGTQGAQGWQGLTGTQGAQGWQGLTGHYKELTGHGKDIQDTQVIQAIQD